METFQTPAPIRLTVELSSGEVNVLAGERGTVVVDVRPRDAAKSADVQAAEQVRVDFTDTGELVVKNPKSKKRFDFLSFGSFRGSVDVRVQLPEGSDAKISLGVGETRCAGRLGDCRVSAGLGDIAIHAARSMKLETGKGSIRIGSVESGDIKLTSGFGELEIGVAEGTAARLEAASGFGKLRNALDDVAGPEASDRVARVKAHTGFGDITIRRAEPSSLCAEPPGDGASQNRSDQQQRPEDRDNGIAD